MGLLALVFCAFGCATPSPAPPATQDTVEERVAPEPKRLTEIRVVDQNGSMDVLLTGSDGLVYTAFKAIDPLRLVVDLPDTVAEDLTSPLAVENEIIGKIETVILSQEPQPMTRVEIGLNREIPYEISHDQNQIRVQFEKPVQVAEATTVEIVEAGEPEPEATAAEAVVTEETVSAGTRGEQLPLARKILAVQPVSMDQGSKVVIFADGRVEDYFAFALTDPARLVLDLGGLESAVGKAAIPVADPLVEGIRLGTYSDKVRVVFDLVPEAGVPYKVTAENDRLVVLLEPGSGFSSAQPAPTPQTTAAKSTPASIQAIDFNLLASGKSRLTITADRPLAPEVQITGANTISLVFPNASIPVYLQRYIDTGQFTSAVNLIDPRVMQGRSDTVEFHIEMREMLPYHVSLDQNLVYLDFDPSDLPPEKPIQLAKPATMTQPAGTEPLAAEEQVSLTEVEGLEAEAPEAVAASDVTEPAEAVETASEAAEPVPAAGLRDLGEEKAYTGQKISLDLQDVDIRNVLRLLADVTGKNMVVEPNVRGKVTLKVDRVPWDQVLELVLRINDLDSVIEGNVIRIATAAKIQAEIDRRRAEVEAQKELLAAARDLGEVSTAYLQVNYADATEISAQIDTIKSEQGTISIDPRTNLIIYSDFPKRLETARDILTRLDRPTPQVIIECRIVNATSDFSRSIGVSWNTNYRKSYLEDLSGGGLKGSDFAIDTVTAGASVAGFDFTRVTRTTLIEIDAQIAASETVGQARIISAPRIYTLDGVEAKIEQGTEIPYQAESESGGTTTEFKPATLQLVVTPHITPDDRVRIRLDVSDKFVEAAEAQAEPPINTRSAQTELLVNNGDTVVVGGIVQSQNSWAENRTPWMANIPVLGWLFKQRTTLESKDELLIFLNPVIIRPERIS
jgi:type IV pilus assembly protein PilQ